MLGNFVTGCSVIGPAGMLGELSSGLDVSIRDAGLLITYGAAVPIISAYSGLVTRGGSEGVGQATTRAVVMSSLAVIVLNFVISTNTRAVRLWESLGFTTVGRLPGAFSHPTDGYVDALVMYQLLA